MRMESLVIALPPFSALLLSSPVLLMRVLPKVESGSRMSTWAGPRVGFHAEDGFKRRWKASIESAACGRCSFEFTSNTRTRYSI